MKRANQTHQRLVTRQTSAHAKTNTNISRGSIYEPFQFCIGVHEAACIIRNAVLKYARIHCCFILRCECAAIRIYFLQDPPCRRCSSSRPRSFIFTCTLTHIHTMALQASFTHPILPRSRHSEQNVENATQHTHTHGSTCCLATVCGARRRLTWKHVRACIR